jgi:hypothetical protein
MDLKVEGRNVVLSLLFDIPGCPYKQATIRKPTRNVSVLFMFKGISGLDLRLLPIKVKAIKFIIWDKWELFS